MTKSEKTDVHYRCLDGAASFNWRFVFDFDYDLFQRRIQAYKKKRWFRKKSSELVEPYLVIQIWDNNKFKKDKYIGQCQLNLLGFDEGLMDEDEIEAVGYQKEGYTCTCCKACTAGCMLCIRTRCCTKMPKKRKKKAIKLPRAPRYVPRNEDTDRLSLFQQRAATGFWPCTATNLPPEQRAIEDERAKKHDQTQPDVNEDEVDYVTGLVEMELALLPLEEAQADPVGKKRKKPNHVRNNNYDLGRYSLPYLEPPSAQARPSQV